MTRERHEDGLPPYLSYSQLESFQQCPRRYYYRYVRGLRQMDQVGLAAIWSRSVLHPALARWYEQGRTVDEQQWADLERRYRAAGGAMAALDPLYSMETARRCLEVYAERMREDEATYEVVEQPEHRLELMLPSGARYVSVVDVLLRERASGDLWVLDFKSSKGSQPRWSLPFNQQLLGYVVATGAAGFLVSGFTLKQTKARLAVEHERWQVPVTEDLKQAWLAETADTVAMVLNADAGGLWPKRSSACYSYGQACPFLAACSTGAFGEGVVQRWQEAPERGAKEVRRE